MRKRAHERDFRRFQRVVSRWAHKTFPASNDRAKLNHLAKEVEELRDDPSAEEAADCLLILLHFAGAHGFDLYDAALAKFGKVQKRKWGKPGKDGVVEHVREGDERRGR